MSVGPSSPLPGAQGPGPGGRAAPPPRRLTGRPWPLPLPSRPVAASSSSPHPARAQSARRPRAPPPAPHSSPPLPGGGCGASPERARVPRPEDGWMERARTRACARAPLSPSLRAGARPSASALQPPPLPPPAPLQHPAPALPSSSFFRFRAPSDCSRLLEGPERVHLPRGRSSAAFAPGGGDRAGRRGATPPSKVPADGDGGGEMGGAFGGHLGQSPSRLGPAGPIGWWWVERRSRYCGTSWWRLSEDH
eukprot:XP_022278614.1 uncharacterized protein LOC102157391 [Canis lupus familiaris]